jgi:cysteine synthase B
MGVARFFHEHKPKVRIVGIEPRLGHKVQGLKNMKEAIIPEIYRPETLDEKITIDDELAFATARELAAREGLFVGMSSGAAVAGALQVAAGMTGGTIVTLLPDRGDRYLSTTLFRSVCACCPP